MSMSRSALRVAFAFLLCVPFFIGMAGCGGEEEDAPVGPEAASPASTALSAAAIENALKEQGQLAEAYSDAPPEARLGARIFHDNRLSNPGANLAANCRTCHVPPEASGGSRQYADMTPLSVVPANARGSKQETLRNAPTLLDVAGEISFNADGAFTNLADFLAHKLTSTHMGWLPGEEDQAKDEIFALLLNDQGEDPLASSRPSKASTLKPRPATKPSASSSPP